MRSGRVLPEHVDLGLRLTVGEGILKKPFLQSTHGEGHFPEMSAQTEPSPNAYFPGGYPGTYFYVEKKSTFSEKRPNLSSKAEGTIAQFLTINDV